ncbi:MAG: hypothetical protein LQ338_006923 [Usnochroma carphineum]|nr:MAG: hypothetical protein LQ338_006923 [Usnochroma carphineum]
MSHNSLVSSSDPARSDDLLEAAQKRWDDHPVNPLNWPASKKWRIALTLSLVTLLVGINATAVTTPSLIIAERFHVSDVGFPNSYWPVTVWNTGAALGPLVGLPLLENFGIRTGYVLIIYCALLPFVVAVVKETRGPIILSSHAKKDHSLAKAANEMAHPPLSKLMYEAVTRPVHLLCTEPVVFFLTLWAAFCFGLVFIMTQSVAQVYSTTYDFSDPASGLVQVALFVGETFGFFACLPQNGYYQRSAARNPVEPGVPIPEARLPLSVLASLLGLAGGLFWYGWGSFPHVHWILPTIGLAFVGFGIMVVITTVDMYITDAYTKYAGSAIAAVAFGENLFAAWLPLAAKAMYTNLGFQWASSLLGFLALTLTLAPILLVWKGESIRKKSRFISEAKYS